MSAQQRIAAMVLVALVGLLAGFLVYRTLPHPAPAGSVTAVTDNGTAAPVGAAGTDTANHPVPDTVPDVRLPDLGGTLRSLRSYLGHPLIINFWATWCAPCRREMPLLEQLRQHYGPQQLQVVGIAVDFRSAVASFQQQSAVGYPLLIGEDRGLDAAQQFGMQVVLPFSVFALADGRIVALKIGELHRDEADYILAAMDAVADGHSSLPQARQDIAERLKQLAIERAKAAAAQS